MRYLHLIRIESEQFLVQMDYSSLFQRSEVHILFLCFAFFFVNEESARRYTEIMF